MDSVMGVGSPRVIVESESLRRSGTRDRAWGGQRGWHRPSVQPKPSPEARWSRPPLLSRRTHALCAKWGRRAASAVHAAIASSNGGGLAGLRREWQGAQSARRGAHVMGRGRTCPHGPPAHERVKARPMQLSQPKQNLWCRHLFHKLDHEPQRAVPVRLVLRGLFLGLAGHLCWQVTSSTLATASYQYKVSAYSAKRHVAYNPVPQTATVPARPNAYST
jgi:hypothetical protein